MIPEHHSTPPSVPETRGETTLAESRESLAFSPVYDVAERPDLKVDEATIYDAWVEEIKIVFAKMGAKSSDDFRRILTKNPKALTVQELERVQYLMDRVHFAWRHGRLPPETPEKPGEILENMELPFDGEHNFLVRAVATKGKPYFLVKDRATGRSWFILDDQGRRKGPEFSSIADIHMIGDSLCCLGIDKSGETFALILLHGQEIISRPFFFTPEHHEIVDVQGKPAWLEFEQGKVFVSLEGTHVGDPQGYDEIKEFNSYEGKLLFQARKGKGWHTLLDGKEVHSPTHKREMYQHFGMSEGQLLYTKTEETNWLVTKTNKVQVYKGESILQTLKNIEHVKIIDVGEGHVATRALYPARPEGLFQASPSGMHTWIDGQHVGNKQGYAGVEKIGRIGHALACLIQYRYENTKDLGKPIFCLDGVKFPQFGATHEFLELNGDIILVTSDLTKGYAAIRQYLRGEVLWADDRRTDPHHFPKIEAVFGKLWARVFAKGGWRVLFDGKEIPLDKKAENIGSPIIVGSHILFWIRANENYYLLDQEGFSHGEFSSIPEVEPIDEDRCYVYGQKGRDANAKLIRRVIEL